MHASWNGPHDCKTNPICKTKGLDQMCSQNDHPPYEHPETQGASSANPAKDAWQEAVNDPGTKTWTSPYVLRNQRDPKYHAVIEATEENMR